MAKNNFLSRSIATSLVIVSLLIPTKLVLATSQPIAEEVVIPKLETAEDKVINKLKEIQVSLETMFSSDNIENVANKIVDEWQLVTDFFFNDGEIEGLKFSDLTNQCKVRAYLVLSKINNIIDRYMEDPSNAWQEDKERLIDIYNKYRELLLDFIAKNYQILEESLSVEDLQMLKKLLSDLKVWGSNLWDGTKDIGSDLADIGSKIVDDTEEDIKNGWGIIKDLFKK